MKKLSFFTASLFTLFVSQAQSDSTTTVTKQKSFNAFVRTMDNKLIKGKFYAINDSQVLVEKSTKKLLPIPAENIRSFTLKRKNVVLKSALIGFGAGALTGIIVGYASGDDPVIQYAGNDVFSAFGASLNNAFAMTAGQKAAAAGIGLGLSGAIIGTIIGVLAKKKFIIGGKKERFHDLQSEIMMKLVKK